MGKANQSVGAVPNRICQMVGKNPAPVDNLIWGQWMDRILHRLEWMPPEEYFLINNHTRFRFSQSNKEQHICHSPCYEKKKRKHRGAMVRRQEAVALPGLGRLCRRHAEEPCELGAAAVAGGQRGLQDGHGPLPFREPSPVELLHIPVGRFFPKNPTAIGLELSWSSLRT